MRVTPGDEPAPPALEAGAGAGIGDPPSERVEPLAEPRPQLGERLVRGHLALNHAAVEEIG